MRDLVGPNMASFDDLGFCVGSRRTLPDAFPLRWHVSAQGNCEMKCRSPLCAVFSPDLSPIGLDDGARDRQSEAGSMLLGRVERVEDLVDHLLRDAGTRIAHHYLDFGIRDASLSGWRFGAYPKGCRPSRPSRSLPNSTGPAADEWDRREPTMALCGLQHAGQPVCDWLQWKECSRHPQSPPFRSVSC